MKKIMLFASFIVLLLIVLNPAEALSAAQNALVLCGKTVIPSLFPFLVCSNLLISLGGGAILSRFARGLMYPLFKINGSGALPLIIGLLSGYPCGAVTTCTLYSKGAITKNEAHRLLAFTNNSGPLFIISAVGISIYQSRHIGIILYASHALAALSAGFVAAICASAKKDALPQPTMQYKSPASAVSDSVEGILNLCGYVVFFSVLLSLLQKTGFINIIEKLFVIVGISPYVAKLFSCGIFEITTALSTSECTFLPAVSAVISLGGISVLFQTMSYTKKCSLSIWPYVLGKIMCCGFSAFYTQILLYLFPVSVKVFSALEKAKTLTYIPYLATFLLASAVFVVFYITKMPQGDK